MRRLKIFEWLVLIVIAIGAGPASSAIWQWSTTAATNAGADPSINWAEGMSPSSVNDSARAMMAAIAAWRNDISAVNTTGGTSEAYTLTTSEGVTTTPSNGQMIAFVAHTTNLDGATLRVDGGNTYPLYLNNDVVPAASMLTNTPYRASFNTGLSAWLLEGSFGNPFNVPLGGVVFTTFATAPNSNFVAAAGQCISTTTYAVYWVAQGSPPSGACPGGQWAIIDLRGRTIAGLDNLAPTGAANRMTSSANGCGTVFNANGTVCGSESQTLTGAQIPPVGYSGTTGVDAPDHGHIVPNPVAVNSVAASGGAGVSVSIGTVLSSGANVRHAHNFSGTIAGGGGAHPIVQPTMGLNPWLRVK